MLHQPESGVVLARCELGSGSKEDGKAASNGATGGGMRSAITANAMKKRFALVILCCHVNIVILDDVDVIFTIIN